MTNRDRITENIMSNIDDALGRSPGEHSLEDHKQAVFSLMAGDAGKTARFGMRFPRFAAAAVFVLAVAGIVAGIYWPSPYSFTIGRDNRNATEGSWVSSGIGETKSIVFENGSRFELAEKSEIRVAEVSKERIQIDLNTGEMDVWINGDGVTDWVVRAGPYKITVVGTVFKVRWIQSHKLEVEVIEGRVKVEDTLLEDNEVTLLEGYRLSRNSNTNEVDIRATTLLEAEESLVSSENQTSEDAPIVLPENVGEIALTPPSNETPEQRRRVAQVNSNDGKDPAWRHRCEEGDFDGVIRESGQQELQAIANEADLETLWQLSNAARYQKRVGAATGLLKAVRQRFPKTGSAATAAFIMAKTAMEANDNNEMARKWFMTYLEESPGGKLEQEALGHLIGINVQIGREIPAKKVARDYLEKYPSGVFAKQARRVLEH